MIGLQGKCQAEPLSQGLAKCIQWAVTCSLERLLFAMYRNNCFHLCCREILLFVNMTFDDIKPLQFIAWFRNKVLFFTGTPQARYCRDTRVWRR